MDKLTVLVADDHPFFRQRIINIINVQPDIKVVGEASDVRETLTKAHDLRPDVILMDINLPGCDGTENNIRLILNEQPDACIVVLMMRDEEEKLFEAIKSGARGYLHKTVHAKLLIDILHGTQSMDTTRDGTWRNSGEPFGNAQGNSP
jgi:DNA-binding NarL/FixJ family response regulator